MLGRSAHAAGSAALALAALLACRSDPVRPMERLSPPLQALTVRAEEYAALRRRVAAALPPLEPTSDPSKIEDGQKALVEALRAARPAASPGDVIDPAAAGELRRIVRGSPRPELAPRSGDLVLRVNATYPQNQPLATMSPEVLRELPPLPKELEFRIAGGALLLLDRETRLIVDLVPDAIRP